MTLVSRKNHAYNSFQLLGEEITSCVRVKNASLTARFLSEDGQRRSTWIKIKNPQYTQNRRRSRIVRGNAQLSCSSVAH